VVKKVVYFEQFNNDNSIKKYPTTTDLTLFRLLKAQKIDAIIMECIVGDIHIKRLGFNDDFKHANYINSVENQVYLTISKQSPLLSREEDVSQALQSMINEGEIKQIMSSYGVLDIKL
jgi:polar amino acid transport system substrate-binding protein